MHGYHIIMMIWQNGNIKVIREKTHNYMILGTVLYIGFIFLAPEVFKCYASKEYWDMIKYIPIIASSSYIVLLYTFAVNFEFYKKKTIITALGSSISAICNIILNYILIPKYTVIGAVIATFISYMILLIFHQTLSNKISTGDYHIEWRKLIVWLFIVFGVIVLSYLIYDYWYIRWCLVFCICVIYGRRIFKQKSIF